MIASSAIFNKLRSWAAIEKYWRVPPTAYDVGPNGPQPHYALWCEVSGNFSIQTRYSYIQNYFRGLVIKFIVEIRPRICEANTVKPSCSYMTRNIPKQLSINLFSSLDYTNKMQFLKTPLIPPKEMQCLIRKLPYQEV